MNAAIFKSTVEQIIHQVYPDAVVKAPLPCWDSSSLVGVNIEIPKMMGKEECAQIISFALTPVEARDVGTIQKRTMLALNVINFNVVSMFRRKVKADAA